MSDSEERKFDTLTVRIDRSACIGSGSCVNVAPELLELDERQCVTFTQDAATIEPDRIIEACEVCPVEALFVFDDEKQIVP